ncbi:MAG: hypothetical protein LDL39_00765 [Magnetospirillum sp.]|nr:hypothetical protein [Magnetospirillum sp.]
MVLSLQDKADFQPPVTLSRCGLKNYFQVLSGIPRKSNISMIDMDLLFAGFLPAVYRAFNHDGNC